MLLRMVVQYYGNTYIYLFSCRVGNKYDDDNTTVFTNNTAPYAPNIGSYAKNLIIEFIDNNDYLNRVTYTPTYKRQL